jgi:DNA polymerase eta
VEQIRLKIPKETPLVCGICIINQKVQWFGILAVSYSARQYGISRSTTCSEALKLYPNLILAHSPTYYFGEHEYSYHANPQKATHKISLNCYRLQSMKIMDIIQQECTQFEKASIDEAFVDVTDEAQMLLSANDDLPVYWNSNTNVLGEVNFGSPVQSEDLLLYYASQISSRIRKRIFDELGYTCR